MKNIYLFIGEEQVSIQKRINRLISDSNIDEFNITTYDLEVDGYEVAIEDALTIPFMSDNKVVIIKNPVFLTKTSTVKDYGLFLKYLKKPMDSTVLIINAGNLTLNDKIEAVQELKKKAEMIVIKKPSDVEMHGILKMACQHAGVHIKEEAVKKFFELIGADNLSRVKTESDKLITYVDKGGVITEKDVLDLVVRDYETDVFALTNAIITKDCHQAYKIYQDLILGTNDPVSLINQIALSMRNIYAVGLLLEEGATQNDISSRLSIKSGYAYNLINNCKKLEMNEVKHYINLLGELDYKIKSGKVQPKNGLELFLLGI